MNIIGILREEKEKLILIFVQLLKKEKIRFHHGPKCITKSSSAKDSFGTDIETFRNVRISDVSLDELVNF